RNSWNSFWPTGSIFSGDALFLPAFPAPAGNLRIALVLLLPAGGPLYGIRPDWSRIDCPPDEEFVGLRELEKPQDIDISYRFLYAYRPLARCNIAGTRVRLAPGRGLCIPGHACLGDVRDGPLVLVIWTRFVDVSVARQS